MQREDLTKNFVQTIKKRIFEGVYEIGDNFPTLRELAQEFNCSRSVINVGIARLEAQGYLKIQKRQKSVTNDFINKSSLEIIKDMALSDNEKYRQKASRDILEARLIIEIQSVKDAAEFCPDTDIKKLLEIVEKEEKLVNEGVNDYKKIAQNDFMFHYQLTRMSQNMVYYTVMNSFKDTALEMTKRFYKNNIELFKEYVKKHKLIAIAIKEKDSQRAAKILEEILTHGERLYKNL